MRRLCTANGNYAALVRYKCRIMRPWCSKNVELCGTGAVKMTNYAQKESDTITRHAIVELTNINKVGVRLIRGTNDTRPIVCAVEFMYCLIRGTNDT